MAKRCLFAAEPSDKSHIFGSYSIIRSKPWGVVLLLGFFLSAPILRLDLVVLTCQLIYLKFDSWFLAIFSSYKSLIMFINY